MTVVATQYGNVTVEPVYVRGVWAVTPRQFAVDVVERPEVFDVTHLPSGRCAPCGGRLREECTAIVDDLAAAGLDRVCADAALGSSPVLPDGVRAVFHRRWYPEAV